MEICDVSLATVKIRIHRARARLKAALDVQCDFYRDGENVFRCNRKAG
jgi:RNA polymerase sigma-70 factor (ECF subfamily)